MESTPWWTSPNDNKVITDPIEQWCFFFRLAQTATADELMRYLPDPAFSEATGVLEMISRDPDQRSLYEARLKCERDVRAHQEQARKKGREEGREEGRQEGESIGLAKGESIGKIKLLQQLLGDKTAIPAHLERLSREQLAEIEQELQSRLRERS